MISGYRFLKYSAIAMVGMCSFMGAAANDYLVIDVSAGYNQPYPVTYHSTLPLPVTDNSYKTDKIVLKRIPAGSFMMGSPTNEVGRPAINANEDLHQVTLTQDYYIGVYEITEAQWSKVTALQGSTRNPVVSISYGVQIQDLFLAQINSGTDLGLQSVDLPTEAQWEYACRAGTATPYSFGSDINQLQSYAWYQGYDGLRHEVGLKLPNLWGLYDMHGNAAEFCRDAYVAALGTNAVTDPQFPEATGFKVTKTGGYTRPADECRSAYRNSFGIGGGNLVGFRICVTLPPPLPTYALTVVSGSGDGSYTNAHVQQIVADPAPAWYEFDRWTGDTESVNDLYAPTATVTIAGAAMVVQATYRPLTFDIAVVNGTSSVSVATNAQVVAIYADPPDVTNVFYRWEGDTATVADTLAPTTTVTVAGADITLTAVYRHAPYWLSVTSGAQVVTTLHFAGEVVAIQAPAPDADHTFLWVGDTAAVADPQAWVTTLVMPAQDVGLTATYPERRYTLTVTDGYGSGSYTNGAKVSVGTTYTPSALHLFDGWAGDVTGLESPSAPVTIFTMAASDAAIAPRFRPVVATKGDYLVVDLAHSGSAFELTYRDAPPAGGWDNTYKDAKMAFRRLMPGSFPMGRDDDGSVTGENTHTVTLTEAFYIGIFEVTQGQWQKVMGTYPSNYSGSGRERHPVENISYDLIRGSSEGREWSATADVDATSFVGKMRLKGSSDGFDLPTEAQWEYACRAGTIGSWYSSDLLNIAYYSVNSSNRTWDVGLKTPNSWGLYDMHGNVLEWCLDWFYGPGLGTAPQTDPLGPAIPYTGTYQSYVNTRVIRGGCYDLPSSEYMKSGYRAGQITTGAAARTGLRMSKRSGVPRQLTIVDSKVNSGGIYYDRAQIAVSAVDKPGQEFDYWSVEPSSVYPGSRFDGQARDTIITMPSHAVTIRAHYK